MPPTLKTRHTHITNPFVSTLEATETTNIKDDPNYYASTPRDLLSTSTPQTFTTGTGSAIYNSLIPLLESTNQELILVTCFWARSSTLSTLSSILRNLSSKAIQRGTTKIRVRLCFSSLSLFQKLFHTQSVTGQFYGSEVWVKKLGLPSPEDLTGLDLTIKSVFLLPFSVMHPKFMIVDRKTVVLPSCNISWEEWFEGAITFSGPIVHQFLRFYSEFWERAELPALDSAAKPTLIEHGTHNTEDAGHGHITTNLQTTTDIPTIFLPSPHRRNPRFQPFKSTDAIRAPPTPLNSFILTLLEKAEKSIRIQTPNLTSPPVLSALLKALARGINIRILTSEKLMVLEQLVTAGTTTSRCVRKLIKRYQKLYNPSSGSSIRGYGDEEAAIGISRPGRLQIAYFAPVGGLKARGEEEGEPQQSHLKLMVVDDEVLVLGSGNLDRASWFGSQELGVAFFDRGVVEGVVGSLERGMAGRERVVFDSLGG